MLKSVAVSFCMTGLLSQTVYAQPTTDSIRDGAEERIEKYRKADARVTIVDKAGNPIQSVTVKIEQINHEFLFGCNLFYEFPFLKRTKNRTEAASALYKTQFSNLFNYAIFPFFWAEYEPVEGKPIYEQADAALTWCRSAGITAKGHPLVWNKEDPAWLTGDPKKIHQLQMERLRDNVSRFKGRLDNWDVINEVVEYNREKYAKLLAPRQTAMWKQVGPINLARECFYQARKANPDAKLLINDYVKDVRYEKLIETLVDRKARPLYDAIGIQCHMHDGARSSEWLWNICEQYSRFKTPLHFTEVTILSSLPTDSTIIFRSSSDSVDAGESYQAREAARVYTILFSHPSVQSITWWDFTDANSWQGAPAGILRNDMSPKPIYDALRMLIRKKWWTTTEVVTAADGSISFRGYLGLYHITVLSADGKQEERDFQLTNKGKNEWRMAQGNL